MEIELKKTFIVPIFAGVVGLLSGMFLSSHDAKLSEQRYFLEKRIDTAHLVATHFSDYVVNWNRVIALKMNVKENNGESSEDERSRFRLYLDKRNSAREQLFQNLDILGLYFSDDVMDVVYKFQDWDQSNSQVPLKDLPKPSEWRKYEKEILKRLKSELKNS